jgi:hypothetical protein
VNGDDDNANGIPDNTEAPVANEDDLIRIEVDGLPPVLPDGYEWVLRRSNSAIKLWMTPTKGFSELFGDEDVAVVEFRDWFIEWVDSTVNFATIELGVRRQNGGIIVAVVDQVLLYRFHSIIIALGGRTQVPTDPPDPNHGTFQLGLDLYKLGYDVHMYNENLVKTDGSGAVFDEVVFAVKNRGVYNIAIFGYSQGGGSTHNLAKRLIDNQGNIGPFSIEFTAYIDAVTDGSWTEENRRPPGTQYLVNYYQTNDGLSGGPIDPPGAEFELDVTTTNWGASATHKTIDDLPQVLNGILNRLLPRVPK